MTVAAVFARRSAGIAVSRTTRSIVSRPTYNGLTRCSQTPITYGLPSLVRYYADKSFPDHQVIAMPALSPTMTAGNIGTWQKKAGDTVSAGDVLVEIETDKAQMDFEYQEEGVIAKILLESGEKDVAVGSPIAVIVEDAADVDAFKDFSIEDAGGKKEAKKEEPKEEEASAEPSPSESDKQKPSESKSTGGSETKSESKSAPAPEAEESSSSGGKLQTSLERLDGIEFMASPAAKVLALKNGVPLKDVKGSGSGGRITKEDVEKYKGPAGGSAAGPAGTGAGGAASPPIASSGPATYEDIPITGMRKSIGSRLQQSKVTAPHYYVSSRVSVSKLMKLRQAVNASANGEFKISVNDILVKALGVSLLKHPKVNSAWLEKEGVIRQYSVVDVSVAVATPSGLITPIVKSAHAKGLATISSEIKALALRARDNKLKPEEYQGGTFTISNMGMNDAVSEFTAIINPPQSGILAVGSVKRVAVEGKDGSVEFEDQIVMTGSFDHRTVDGAVGGEFMKTLKKVLENPLELML